MLAENSANLSDDELVSRAFKEDDVDKSKENMELYNQYFRGGIEWLYEMVTDDATTKEDYLNNINELIETFKKDFSDSFDYPG